MLRSIKVFFITLLGFLDSKFWYYLKSELHILHFILCAQFDVPTLLYQYEKWRISTLDSDKKWLHEENDEDELLCKTVDKQECSLNFKQELCQRFSLFQTFIDAIAFEIAQKLRSWLCCKTRCGGNTIFPLKKSCQHLFNFQAIRYGT